MAVRINLRKVDKPAPKFDAVFSGDRTAALANMESPPAAALTTPPANAETSAVAGQDPASAAGGELAASGGPGATEPVAPDMAASAVALRMVHAAAAAPAPAVSAEGEPVVAEASEALLTQSSKPATMKAVAIVLKWSLIGGVLLGGGYYAMRHVLFPVATEMQKAKTAPVAVDKNASSLVQAVQQARVTVAKNDAKVDYLNQIIEGPKEEPKPVVEAAPPPPKPVVRAPVAKDLSAYREAIDALKISAVLDGDPPRLFIDNIIVKPGEVVNRPLGISFGGIDPAERVLYFTNKDNEIFRKAY